MKFGTRLVLYYSLTSMLVMLIVGAVVIKSIETYWIDTVEQELTGQNKTVQDYIRQVFLFEKDQSKGLDEEKAKRVTSNLSSGIGQLQIYSNDLKLLSGLVDVFEHPDFDMDQFQSKVLLPAQKGSQVNSIQDNIYYYASPIMMDNKEIGILVINYRLDLLKLILNRVVYVLCLGAAAFCLIIIVLSIYISRKMVIPVKRLVSITDNYAKRNFTMVDVQRSDELGQLSKSINDMGLQLQEHINRQKQFVSNVSHEIRTPLAAIKGYSEYLADEVSGSPDLEKAAYHLNNETARLTGLVNDLLQLSRIDSERESFTFERVNLSAVLCDTVERMKDRAYNNGIEFTTDINPDMFINGDKDKLIQVMVNLLDNSIKYSPSDSKVEIRLTAADRHAVLTVSDHGMGIPEGDLEKVFDRFYRAENVRGVTGTGLGLAISKEIIDRHQGRIRLNSQKQGGTTVTLELPLLCYKCETTLH